MRKVKNMLDRLRNVVIVIPSRENLEDRSITYDKSTCKRKWRQHVERMPMGRFPNAPLVYRSIRQKSVGRPRRKWKDRL